MAQSTYTGDYRFDTTPSANPTPNNNDKNNINYHHTTIFDTI